MPRKTKDSDPVAAFLSASQLYAKAKSELQRALAEKSLSNEQSDLFELLKDGFGEHQDGRQTTTPKRREAASAATVTLEQEKTGQIATNNLAR